MVSVSYYSVEMERLELISVQPRETSSMYYRVLFLLSFICVCIELLSVFLVGRHNQPSHLLSSAKDLSTQQLDHVKATIDS